MTDETQIKPQPLRTFIWQGGLKAIQAASFSSVSLFLLYIFIGQTYYSWKNSPQNSNIDISYVLSGIFAIGLLSLLAILFSILPSFLGGVLLAWLLHRDNVNSQLKSWRLLGKGFITGLLAGFVVSGLVLTPSYLISMTAHGGFGFDPTKAILRHLIYAFSIVTVASLAGAWTEKQIRKSLFNNAA